MPKIGSMSTSNPISEARVVRTTLEIGELGRKGEGIAKGPEGLIFVLLALPGERVEADVEGRPWRSDFTAAGITASKQPALSLFR